MKQYAAVIICVCGMMPVAARAQGITVTATVSAAQVQLGSSITLDIQVAGDVQNLPDLQGLTIPQFDVRSAGRSQSVSIVNGAVSSIVSYSYMLRPQAAGKFSLGPFIVALNGKQYASQPVVVTVTDAPPTAGGTSQAAAPPAGLAQAEPAFVTTEVNTREPYVGQEVVLSFRFFRRVRVFGDSQYQPPQTVGFIKEDMPPQNNYHAEVSGRQYMVSEIITALFPTSMGKLTIGPAGLSTTLETARGGRQRGDDFFRQFFSPGQRVQLQSDPIIINARPVPERGRPKGFSGAVGRFLIEAATDKQEAMVNEPVTLTVTVSGTGNIKAINEPAWPDSTDFKSYDAVSSVTQEVRDHHVAGAKVFQKVFIPQRAGALTLDRVQFSDFDPEREQYETLTAGPFSLTVRQGDAPVGATVGGFLPPKIKRFGTDILFQKDAAHFSRADRPLLHRTTRIRLVFALPMLVYAGLVLMLWRRHHQLMNRGLYRSSRALRRARQQISRAARAFKRMPNAQQYAGALADAVRAFIADKFDRVSAGLTGRDIIAACAGRGIDEAVVREALQALDELDFLRFAPGGSADLNTMDRRLTDIIQKIERECARV